MYCLYQEIITSNCGSVHLDILTDIGYNSFKTMQDFNWALEATVPKKLCTVYEP